MVMIMSQWKSIGDGVEITMLTDRLDRFVGLIERHICKNKIETTTIDDPEPTFMDGQTGKSVLFDLPWNNTPENSGRPKWTVESWEPLTLSPSILCRQCGLHGWIREGRWVTDPSAKTTIKLAFTVPVELRIGGESTPVYLGSYESDLNEADLTRDRASLAVLLRRYAAQIDPRSEVVGFVWHHDGEDITISPNEIEIVYATK